MKKTNKIMIIIIIMIILLFILATVLLVFLSKKDKENKTEKALLEEDTHISSYYSSVDKNTDTVKVVTDRNDFFTVQSCVNKYINYLTLKDVDSLYILLDESYIEKFNITKENILEHVEDLSGGLIYFRAKKMYCEQINESIYKYYVTGEILEESYEGEDALDNNEVEEIKNKGEIRITVNMDIDNMLFSIVPYSYGGTFYE